MEPAQPRTQRSTLAILVVAGAILGFGALFALANYSPDPPSSSAGVADPFAKGKAKVNKAKVPRVDPETLWVEGEPFERPAAPAGAKNVVLVVLTAVRKDALTPYGAPPDRTPVLQDLASKGARFTDALAAAPFSRQSAVAYLSGRHALGVGAVEPSPDPDESVLPADAQTLAEALRAAGWHTFGVTANPNLDTPTGLAQGFDRYRNAPPNGFTPGARVEGEALVPAALEALTKRTPEQVARPFYLQLDLVDAHAPLRVMNELEEKFDPSQPNAAYRVAVWREDKFVGRLLEGLAELGHTVATDTYVVVISDHGEGNEDPPHHGKMHGKLLYDSVISIPWIVAGPNVAPNRLVGGLASQTDVMPTVLGLVGLPAPAGVDGQSWAPMLFGEGDRTTRTRAFSDTWFGGVNRAAVWTEAMMCQKDFGSVGADDPFADGCYERRTDPLSTNLKQDPALQAELDAWRAEQTKATP
ncbi:MAG: sulfatase [Myxococcota bacterium]